MKKILVTLIGLAVSVSLVHAQGFVELFDQAAGVTTNTGTFGNTGTPDSAAGYNSIVSGKTFSGNVDAYSFYEALLFIPNSGTPTVGDTASPNGSDWVQLAVDNGGTVGAPLLMTNYPSTAGGIEGNGQNNSTAAIGIGSGVGSLNGQAYVGGTSYYTMLVGWSSNLGTTWSALSAQLQSGVWSAAGFFGFEQGVSFAPATAAPGASVGQLGFANGSLALFSVAPTVVPEPATIALAGLGGLSMLFLRRRKS